MQEQAVQIRAAMDRRDFESAEQLTRGLRADNPAAFAANNYDYLLGRLCERRGALTEATALYLGLLKRNSILSQYALWRLAVVARASGDLAFERQYITRLLASYPASALARRARERMIDSLRESGDYRSTISLLRPLASPNGVTGRSAMSRLGEAYAKTGNISEARNLMGQLVASSRDDYALAAATELDGLDRAAGVRPAEFDALRRARIYLFNRHWAEARAHLLDIVERFPDSPNRPEALYQTGFTFYREEKHDEAIKWFERAHREFPTKKEGEQGYYYVGTALQRARRYEEAARRYADFITAYPKSDLVDGAYRNVVDSLRYAGKDDEAIEWSRRIQQVYAGKPLATVGLFNEARIEMARGRMNEALALLTRLAAQPAYARLFSAPIRGEAAFLRVVALERLGRLNEAVQAYLAIPDERDNYFGHRATMRLRALARAPEGRRLIEGFARRYQEQARAALSAGRYDEAKGAAGQALRLTEDPAAERAMLDILRASYSQLPAYSSVLRYRLIPVGRDVVTSASGVSNPSNKSLAAELLFLGLYDEGATELRLGGFGEEGESAGGDWAYSLAVYSNRGDQSHHAIAFAEPLFNSIPRDYRIELMPRDLAELMYPAPYRDAFDRYAPQLGVDPRLVLALARQESRFNPAVKSAAAARGLLQFISETAEAMAEEEGMEKFELDDVYDPNVAVRLAVRYVNNLTKMFPDNPYAVMAAYNTGEINVERWIFRARSNDIDLLIAEVAIPETKDYVAKVMSNYQAYRQLYTSDLKPRRAR
ncbi:MAG TPA: tetratricopeptide repeat protein [Blastocatellia bacterium]|nr:tetratricopeptide repeat protein [Blastocatellia bacterium]